MERVYHYTSMNALLKLLESVETSSDKKSFVFRATNIFFLNDPQEFVYGQNVLMEVLNEIEYEKEINHNLRISSLFSRHTEKTEKEWLKILLDDIHDKNASPYVISFSRNIDSLPMWLNYGDHGKGICLAFAEYRSRVLGSDFTPSSIDEVKVEIYDSLGTYDVNYDVESVKKEDNILRKQIEKIYDFYLNNVKMIQPNELFELQRGMLNAFTEVIAPYIKSKEYEGEKEVRLAKTVLRDKGNTTKEINFRCNAKGNIVPYIDIEIPQEQLDYVSIGPLADKELSIKVIEMMKNKFGLKFDVKESKVKYREY